jgi:membrane protein YdbS with pleckstrin-like domain
VVRARGIQAALAATATVFALMLLVMLHIAAFAALVEIWPAPVAALVVAAGDLVLMAILGLAGAAPAAIRWRRRRWRCATRRCARWATALPGRRCWCR